MSRIEWQETIELKPPNRSLQDFCQDNHISQAMRGDSSKTLAFIERQALEQLHEFLLHDLSREHGGVLLGQPFFDPEEERYFAVVRFAIPAKETEGSPVHFRFTPRTWAHLSSVIDQNHRDTVIVGWYHSHPGLGVFMSSIDRATQKAFCNHPWNLAVVVDPIAQKTGWFAGEECIPLNRDQVVMYEEPAGQETPADEGTEEPSRAEEGRQDARSATQTHWLLPFVGITVAFAVGAIWFLRNGRFRAKASSS